MKRQDSDWRQLGLFLVLVSVLFVSPTISLASRPIPPRMNKPNNAKLNSNWQIPYTINNGKLVLGSGWQQGSLIPARNSLLKTIPTGQPADKCDRIIWNKLTRTPRFFKGHLNPSTYQYKVNSANRDDQGLSQQILTTIRENQHYFTLSEPDKDLQLVSIKESDERIHVKYSQFFKGLPVFNHQLIFHCNKQGDILSYLGDYIHPDQLVNAVVDQPIALDQATMAVRQDLQIPIPQPINLQHDFNSAGLLQPERGIWIDFNGKPHDAWRINVMPRIDENWIYYVSTLTGEVVFKHNTVTNGYPTTAFGYDVFGNLLALNAYVESGMIELIDTTKPMFSQKAELPYGTIITKEMLDDSTIHTVNSSQPIFGDSVACSVHNYMSLIYDYYNKTFGAPYILDSDYGTMRSIIHYDINYNNAFWDGFYCVFGDGDGEQSAPLAGALDIVAHEFTHGLTDYNANLIYLNQSGALDEFFADFFACMIDRDDWLIGEDVWTPHIPGDALRDMSNPHAGNPPLPDHMSEYLDWPLDWDNGGVHYNCGIPSKAAYLIADAIGLNKTEQIFYKVLTNYLVPSSGFWDIRMCSITVAEILYGEGSFEVLMVEDAFNQVGITEDMESVPYFSETLEAIKGEEWIAYIRADSLIGIAREDLSQIKYFTSFKALYTEYEKTQLSSTRDGRILCFVNDAHKVTFYYLDDPQMLTYKYKVLDNYIHQEGDLHSAVISNDGSQILLTSEYMNDNYIYILDQYGFITAYPQKKPSMDGEDEYSEPIIIDVADWAPDNKVIIYDALYEVYVGNDSSIYYWDISQFVIDHSVTMTLLPTHGMDIQYAYPKFSNNSPYLIAYNYIDNDSHLYIADILKRELYGLVIRGIKPAFSPDNNKLVFQSYNKELYTCNNDSIYVNIKSMNINGENPEWIVIPESVVPVELALFDALIEDGNVVLKWQTASETNNYGFEVLKSPLGNGEVDWQRLGFVPGNGTTSETQTYSFVDKKPAPGKWQYRLKQLDTNGDFSFSDVVTVQVSVPQKFVLYPNYPNPFNATTQISFNLPTDEHVRLDVFDVKGGLITTLFNQEMTAGYHSAEFTCDEQASGVFFYKIVAGDNIQVGKALLVK